ncbi:MAG: class I SAM-dependent RNA methyltransferase [Cyclobacteriaceae bacterium]|nr:class I SAM-dependent RNA methyltransferase [Cyclobacteriaceae bacterium]
MNRSKIVCTCAPEMQHVLARELEMLGFSPEQTDKKAVTVSGTFEDVYLLNHCLRTANRVLFHLFSFNAATPEALYKSIHNFEWEQWIPLSGYFRVDSFTRNDYIRDTRFANLKVKDAIVDRFQNKYKRRPDTGSAHTGAVIFVHWVLDKVQVYVDTSGESIARHGYRQKGGSAPMLENLAAALVMESGWDHNSWFINPMCGSGTLAIEAAMMYAGIYPGSKKRYYAYMGLKAYRESDHQKRIKAMNQRPVTKLKKLIIASDYDKRAIEAARFNAVEAGVGHLIDFHHCDFSKTPVPEGPGVVILNPEYGIRLGEEDVLKDQYKAIGDFFKQHCTGKKGYVFTGNLVLAKSVGLRSSRRIPFMNGDIECRLLEYELYKGKSSTDRASQPANPPPTE